VKSDRNTKERLLNDIFVTARAEKPSRAGSGLRFSLRTLLVAVAIAALSATSAFAAYSAGLNAAQPTDVKELNGIIAALQEQVADLNEEIEVLRGLIVTQYDSKEETPTGNMYSYTKSHPEREVLMQEVGTQSKNFSTLAEAAEFAGVPFKEPLWLPAGTKRTMLVRFTQHGGFYPTAMVMYTVPDVGMGTLAGSITLQQEYVGSSFQFNLDTAYDVETVVINGVEVTVVALGENALELFWIEDGIFFQLRTIRLGLQATLQIVESMGEPVPGGTAPGPIAPPEHEPDSVIRFGSGNIRLTNLQLPRIELVLQNRYAIIGGHKFINNLTHTAKFKFDTIAEAKQTVPFAFKSLPADFTLMADGIVYALPEAKTFANGGTYVFTSWSKGGSNINLTQYGLGPNHYIDVSLTGAVSEKVMIGSIEATFTTLNDRIYLYWLEDDVFYLLDTLNKNLGSQGLIAIAKLLE